MGAPGILDRMKRLTAGGGFPAIWYTVKKGREAGGLFKLWKAMRTHNACKTCALGMGGQAGGMVNETGHFPEVCKKSLQAMVADMAGRIEPRFFDEYNHEKLRSLSPRELESAGRITTPLYSGPLDDRYRPIEWAEAMDRIGGAFQRTRPDRSFFYFSGRSSNEAGFLLQMVARLWGTNNVNNCSFYCHQASGVGLASVTGSGTATLDLKDVDQCDTIFLIGGNPASNHPRFMRTLMELKRRGGKIVVVNPLKELGLERFKVPSDVRSLLFGTRIADRYLMPTIGGDIALLTGIAKVVLERGGVDEAYVRDHTEGYETYRATIDSADWATIEAASGVDRHEIEAAAEVYLKSKRTIFAWTMGITHHTHGVENVQAIAALALLRGMVGRPGAGLLPLRGHSNVQGIGSMGVTPTLKKAVFDNLQSHFGVTLPTSAGLDTMACIERAAEGGIDVAVCLGGNLFGSNPDAVATSRDLGRIGTLVHLSTTLNTGHCCGLGRETIILPVLARDEESQRTTQESMFNFVRLSDGGPPRHEGPRSEVEVIADLASRIVADLPGETPIDWDEMRDHRTIRHAIARIVPGYEAIDEIDETSREFTIDGRIFHEPSFPTESGRASFQPVSIPRVDRHEDELVLMTVRSEGQFNTVVYEEEDLYRGQDRRDVVLLHRDDMAARGIEPDQLVEVTSEIDSMRVVARPYDIARGCACMYYPEANRLVPRAIDRSSRTPAFKSIPVLVEAFSPAPAE
ncbi:MAG: FdhF/YdeP family oxidoreductase [Planctomycetota bacterium]|nr:FdhF/YdeP family oxidoreductase [Planctomycetota bacterium]